MCRVQNPCTEPSVERRVDGERVKTKGEAETREGGRKRSANAMREAGNRKRETESEGLR